jgi:hypothetical protein
VIPGPHRIRSLEHLREHAARHGITIPRPGTPTPPDNTLTTPGTPQTHLNMECSHRGCSDPRCCPGRRRRARVAASACSAHHRHSRRAVQAGAADAAGARGEPGSDPPCAYRAHRGSPRGRSSLHGQTRTAFPRP